MSIVNKMGKFQSSILISLALLASNVIFAYSPKIDFTLSKTLERDGQADILVSLKPGTRDILNNLGGVTFSSRAQRSQAVYDALTARAQNSQNRILNFLSVSATSNFFKYGKVQSLWITNQIAIQVASQEFIEILASMDEISRIQEDEIEQLIQPIESRATNENSVKAVNQWGIQMIQAPEAWSLFNGTDGSGIIVAGIDTGVRYSHNILLNNYKNDSHDWFDPYNATEIPHDYHGHGTHTIGTIVGLNGFGVAPGAQWIACKGLYDNGSGSTSALITCGQFLICPTAPNGTDADCSKTPHIVNNSWGGDAGRTYYDEVIAAWHAAGIIPIFAVGNSGTNCGTIGSPGDRDVIGCGSTTIDDELSYFSSVGPSVFSTLKPEISAPGSTVMSADHRFDNTYRIMSGTSMAAPHVAGAVALLLSRRTDLSYMQVKTLLQSYAERDLSYSGSNCSWISDSVFPNHHFGYGRLNIFRSLQALV